MNKANDRSRMQDEQLRWKSEVAALLKRNDLRQKDIANRLSEVTKNSQNTLTPEVSRFVNGDPSVVDRWLGPPVHKYLEALATLLGVPTSEFEEIRTRSRTRGAADDWHPAWPGLPPGRIEIPCPIAGYSIEQKEVREPDKVFENLAKRRETASDKHFPIWVVGPAGSGRRTLARQVRDEMMRRAKDGLPKVELLESKPPEGWDHLAHEAAVHFVAVVESLPEGFREDVRIRPAEWGRVEILALVEQLVACGRLDDSAATACRELADKAGEDPEFLGDGARPAQVIRLVRDVADRGSPRDPAAVREARLASAWDRAIASGAFADSLGRLGPRILESYFAALFSTSQTSPWWRVPSAEACRVLDLAATGRPRPDTGLERAREKVRGLVATGTADPEVLRKVARLLEHPSGEALLLDLLETGLLREEDGHVAPEDADLAVLWAAKGLGKGTFRLERWERLVEPDALHLARECAIGGVDTSVVLRELEKAPEWACVDAARWAVVHVAATARPPQSRADQDRFTKAWAGALLSAVAGTFQRCEPRRFKRDPDPELDRLMRALKSVSRTCREWLPELDEGDVLAHLTELAPEPVGPRVDPKIKSLRKKYESLKETPETGDPADSPTAWVLRLAPWQRPVTTPGLYLQSDLDDGCSGAPWHEVLEWRAEHGHTGAREMLAGVWLRRSHDPAQWQGSEAKEESYWAWNSLPVDMRLRWIGRAGGVEDAREAVCRILPLELSREGFLTPQREGLLTQVAFRMKGLDADGIRRWLVLSGPGTKLDKVRDCRLQQLRLPDLPPDLAMRLAESLGYPEVFEDALSVAKNALDGLRIERRMGHPVVGHEHRDYFDVKGAWTFRGEGMWEWLRDKDRLARDAAVALHRMGRPEALRRRWREGTGLKPTEALENDARQCRRIDRAVRASVEETAASRPPLDACRAVLREWMGQSRSHEMRMPREPWHEDKTRRVRQTFRELEDMGWAVEQGHDPRSVKPLFLDNVDPLDSEARSRLKNTPEALRTPEVDAAQVLLYAIDVDPPRSVDAEVDAWLDRLAGTDDPARSTTVFWDADGWDLAARGEAGGLLLERGDETPLNDWVEGPIAGREGCGRSYSREEYLRWPEATVRSRLKADARLLDRAWDLGRDGPRREDLLDLAQTTPPDDTRSWFFEAVRQEERWYRIDAAIRHRGDPRIVPLLRDLHREAGDARERACLAALLHEREPWCPEVIAAIRRWACEEERPFSSGKTFYWRMKAEEVTVGGGWEVLLDLLTKVPDDIGGDWVRQGALRLWAFASADGWHDDPERQEDWAHERNPATVSRVREIGFEGCSVHDPRWSLLRLLDRLGEHGAVDRFIAPARTGLLHDLDRQVALDLWMNRATSCELHDALAAGDERAWRIASNLAARNDPEAVAWAVGQVAREPDDINELKGSLSWFARYAPVHVQEVFRAFCRRFPPHHAALKAHLVWLLPELKTFERDARLALRKETTDPG